MPRKPVPPPKSTSSVVWLRAACWVGAIADFVVGIMALFPSLMGLSEFKQPMGMAASAIIAWGVLLLWVDRKPVERRGVLLITLLPIFGIALSGVVSYLTGAFPQVYEPYEDLALILFAIVGAAIFGLFFFAWVLFLNV